MRLKVSFDFQVLRGLCDALGGGTVSVQTAKDAFVQATLNAISSDKNNKQLTTAVKRGYTKPNTQMNCTSHHVTITASDNLIKKCGQTKDSFADWLRTVLQNEIRNLPSKNQDTENYIVTVSIERRPI